MAGEKTATSTHSGGRSRQVAFLADAMLGSVARKLRIFGFDTLYMAHTNDDEILARGMAEGRVILTADRELFKRMVKAGAPGVLAEGADEFEDLVHILSKSGIASVDFKSAQPRCATCNGLLEGRTPEQVASMRRERQQKKEHQHQQELPLQHVPGDGILARHSRFFQCASCGKIYWEGGHFRRIGALAKRIDSRLAGIAAVSDSTATANSPA